MAFDKVVFDTDKYNKSVEEDIVSLILDNILSITDEETCTRIAVRKQYLLKQEVSFNELVDIISIKCFSDLFRRSNIISDSSITINSEHKDNKYLMRFGPIRNSEIQKFIKYDINNHIAADPKTKADIVSKILSEYPEVSIYIDIDYYLQKDYLSVDTLKSFWNSSKNDVPDIVSALHKIIV
jgi:hypothetical protein